MLLLKQQKQGFAGMTAKVATAGMAAIAIVAMMIHPAFAQVSFDAATCAGHTNGYSFSDATDNTWLQPLVTGKYISKVPTPPNNGCTSYYRYLNPGATAYNCPSRTVGYYVLIVNGVEGTTTPADATNPLGGGNWVPCVGATAGWGAGSSEWVFQRDE